MRHRDVTFPTSPRTRASEDPRALGPDLELTPLTRGLPLGDRIGRYTLGRWIGSGGMGAVFEATTRADPMRVAVKLIPPNLVTEDSEARLRNEADVLRSLSHRGIVRYVDAGVHRPAGADGPRIPFLVMELVPGAMDIVSFCDSYALAAPDTLELVAAACDALQHAHERGFVHRDIKPSNILIDELGRPRIIDFGVATAASSLAGRGCDAARTRAGQLVGSIAYMAPEQCGSGVPGAQVGAWSDVFAMGAILYELLTGRPAYDFSRTRSLTEAARLRRRPPVRPSRIERSLRGEVESIILRALAEDPSRRHPSAAALADDLRRSRAGERSRPGAGLRGGGWSSLIARLAELMARAA